MPDRSYTVDNISCGHCTSTIERELGALEDVQSVRADVDTKRVTISVKSEASFTEVEALLDEIGFPGHTPGA